MYYDFAAKYSYSIDKGLLSYIRYCIEQASTGSLGEINFRYSYSYNSDDSIKKYTISTPKASASITYTYDEFKRVSGFTHKFGSINYAVSYTYRSFNTSGGTGTDSLITGYTASGLSGADSYTYQYDANNNITRITNSAGQQIRYVYDNLGQLIREDNQPLNCTILYTYDNAGNITTAKKYSLTAAGSTPTSLISTETYTYGNTNWKDQLTAYNGTGITYDAVGNPLSYYNGFSFTWVGMQMQTVSKNTLKAKTTE